MTLRFLFSLTFFSAVTLVNLEAFATTTKCSTTTLDGVSYEITADEPVDGSPATLTVAGDNGIIYDATPVVVTAQATWVIYESPGFINPNHAPAHLYLQVNQDGAKLNGSFSEESFMPFVPYLNLDCTTSM